MEKNKEPTNEDKIYSLINKNVINEALIDETNALINFDEAPTNHGEMHIERNYEIYNDIVTNMDSIVVPDNYLQDHETNSRDQEFVNL